MESTEQNLEEPAFEAGFHQPVHTRAVPDIISVAYAETNPVDIYYRRLWKDLYPYLTLKIVVCPDIVVAIYEKEFHTAVRKMGQSPEDAGELSGDDILVFVPKVKYIAEQIYPGGFLRQRLRKEANCLSLFTGS
jgi:hypothetical protein